MLQQNGIVECKNRHITKVARALMTKKNMPHFYKDTAIYAMKKTPTTIVHDVMPEKQYTCKKPNLSLHCICTCTRLAMNKT